MEWIMIKKYGGEILRPRGKDTIHTYTPKTPRLSDKHEWETQNQVQAKQEKTSHYNTKYTVHQDRKKWEQNALLVLVNHI